VVLERRELCGGLAASEEFHPGYRSAGLLYDTTGIRPAVVEALGLDAHGLRMRAHRPDVLALGREGESIYIDGHPGRAARDLGEISRKEGEAYGAYQDFLSRLRPALAPFLDEPPLDPVNLESNGIMALLRPALRVRRLGARHMMELLRLPAMCVADWLGEWFENELLRATLCLPALSGTFMGPWSPGSNGSLLMREAAAGPGAQGGGHQLVEALLSAARDRGAEIRTEATVESLLVESGAVAGVSLAGGEAVSAPVVAASCDPKHLFLGLAPPGTIPKRLEHNVGGFRTRGTTAHVLLATTGPVRFAGRPDVPVEHARTGHHVDAIERAFDVVKYDAFPEAPALEIHVPTVTHPELAPEGGSVISVLVHFVPYSLNGGWDDEARQRLGDRVVEALATHVPGLPSMLVGRRVLVPPDIESRYGTTAECVGYDTPLPGLFLCGAGSHPGGGLTCGPGALAARAIIRATGTSRAPG
jgi:phytoene dehydrogenase-like protein